MDGQLLNPDSITQLFSGFVRRSEFPSISIHILRHTNATLMIAGGTNIRTVSARLGHTQTSTTANIYSHAIQSADAAAELIEDFLLCPEDR